MAGAWGGEFQWWIREAERVTRDVDGFLARSALSRRRRRIPSVERVPALAGGPVRAVRPPRRLPVDFPPAGATLGGRAARAGRRRLAGQPPSGPHNQPQDAHLDRNDYQMLRTHHGS